LPAWVRLVVFFTNTGRHPSNLAYWRPGVRDVTPAFSQAGLRSMAEDSPNPVGTPRHNYEPFLGGGSVLYELLGTKTPSPPGNKVAAGRRRQWSSRKPIERQATGVAFYESQKHDEPTKPRTSVVKSFLRVSTLWYAPL
jgi:hypothetical protein